MPPLISIVIPNMNGMEHLPECFASLHAANYPADKQEWIVSDNGSRDGSLEFIQTNYPQTRIVSNNGNIGFARGCNNGAAAAKGEYVVFLNNDTRVDPEWLNGFVVALAKDNEAVCAAAHMVVWDGKADDFSGASINLFGVGRQRQVTGWADSPRGLGEGDPLLFACGGAMIIKTSVFQEIGGFDPSFFIYFEDVDLGWRLWVLGYKVVYAANSLVYHKGGGTTGETRAASHRRYLLFEANTLSLIYKNYSQALLDKIFPAALLLEMQRAILSAGTAINREHYALGGKLTDPEIEEKGVAKIPPISVAHVQALGRFVERLPHLNAERKRIQSQRKRSDDEILPLFGWPFQPQFAGAHYTNVVRSIASALDLYPLIAQSAPNRILLLAPASGLGLQRMEKLAAALAPEFYVALAKQSGAGCQMVQPESRAVDSAFVQNMAADADLVIASAAVVGFAANLPQSTPLALDLSGAPMPPQAVVQRAGLLICSNASEAPADGVTPVAVEPLDQENPAIGATLRRFCRYPMIPEA